MSGVNGCTDSTACNYDYWARLDDGSCYYAKKCAGTTQSACNGINDCPGPWNPPWLDSSDYEPTDGSGGYHNDYTFTNIYQGLGPFKRWAGLIRVEEGYWLAAFDHTDKMMGISRLAGKRDGHSIMESFSLRVWGSSSMINQVIPRFRIWRGYNSNLPPSSASGYIRNLYPCACADYDEGWKCDEWFRETKFLDYADITHTIPPFNGSGTRLNVHLLEDWDPNTNCQPNGLPIGV